jgi:two-component system, NarL family, nitrate/nitrite response regulator NarL
MILIASTQLDTAEVWRRALSPEHELYERIAADRKTLELCLKKTKCELLLLDLAILGSEGIHDLVDIFALQPETKIILLTECVEQREEISAILFGAKAYLSLEIAPHILHKVVKTVLSNEVWVDRQFVNRLLNEIQDITQSRQKEAKQLDKGIDLMTPREGEIAELIATGASNRRIAENLSISERTVKAHLGVIFRKIGISDRLQLALYMNRHHQITHVWRARPDSNSDKEKH